MKTQHLFAGSILMATIGFATIANAQLLGGSGALNGALNGGMNGNLSPSRDTLGGVANGNAGGNGSVDASRATERSSELSSRAKSQTEHVTEAGVSKIGEAKSNIATMAADRKNAAVETSHQAKNTAATSVTAIKDRTVNGVDRIKPTAEAAASASADATSDISNNAKTMAKSNDKPVMRSASGTGTAANDKLNKDKSADTTSTADAKDSSLQNTTVPTASVTAGISGAKAQQSADSNSQVHAGNAVDQQSHGSSNNSASATQSNGKVNGAGTFSVDASTH
jgi:hypothetical protein